MSSCIWNTPIKDRHCEYCTFRGGCEKYPVTRDILEVLSDYGGKMTQVLCQDIWSPSRRSELVWGRYLVMYRLHLDGYSKSRIGKVMGMDHTTVMHGINQVTKMLQMPNMYPEEMKIWTKFLSL